MNSVKMESLGAVSLIYVNAGGEELERWVQKYNLPKMSITFNGENYMLKKLKYSKMEHDLDRVTVGVFDCSIGDYARMTYKEALEKYGYDALSHKMAPYCFISIFVPSQHTNIFDKTLLKITQLFHR